MKLSQAKLQQLDTGVKVYNAIFGTNFKLVIRLYDSFYTCDFIKMQDKNLVYLNFDNDTLKPKLCDLIGAELLNKTKNFFWQKYSGLSDGSKINHIKFENLKTHPDMLLENLLFMLDKCNINLESPVSEYPYIYNLKDLDSAFYLPFLDLEQGDYELVSLYLSE